MLDFLGLENGFFDTVAHDYDMTLVFVEKVLIIFFVFYRCLLST